MDTLAKVLRYIIDFDGKLTAATAMQVIASDLTVSHFYKWSSDKKKKIKTYYAVLYEVAYAYFQEYRAPITDVALSQEVMANGKLTSIQKDAVLEALEHVRAFGVNQNELEYDIKNLKNYAVTQHAFAGIYQASSGLETDPIAAVSKLQNDLTTVLSLGERGGRPIDRTQTGIDWFTHMWNEYTVNGGLDKYMIPFPFPLMQEVLGGIYNQELMVVVGPPGGGKTMFMHELGYSALHRGFPVLFAEREMTPEQLFLRWLARETQIPSASLRKLDSLTDLEYKLLLATKNDLEEKLRKDPHLMLMVPYSECQTVKMLELKMRQHYTEGKYPALTVVDYIEEIETSVANQAPYERVAQVTRELKGMALRYNQAGLTASQLNAEGMLKPEKANLSHLSHRAVAKKADVVLLVYEDPTRPYHSPGAIYQHGKPGVLLVKVLKNRQGANGHIFELTYDPSRSLLREESLDSSGVGFSTFDPTTDTSPTGDDHHV